MIDHIIENITEIICMGLLGIIFIIGILIIVILIKVLIYISKNNE